MFYSYLILNVFVSSSNGRMFPRCMASCLSLLIGRFDTATARSTCTRVVTRKLPSRPAMSVPPIFHLAPMPGLMSSLTGRNSRAIAAMVIGRWPAAPPLPPLTGENGGITGGSVGNSMINGNSLIVCYFMCLGRPAREAWPLVYSKTPLWRWLLPHRPVINMGRVINDRVTNLFTRRWFSTVIGKHDPQPIPRHLHNLYCIPRRWTPQFSCVFCFIFNLKIPQ